MDAYKNYESDYTELGLEMERLRRAVERQTKEIQDLAQEQSPPRPSLKSSHYEMEICRIREENIRLREEKDVRDQKLNYFFSSLTKMYPDCEPNLDSVLQLLKTLGRTSKQEMSTKFKQQLNSHLQRETTLTQRLTEHIEEIENLKTEKKRLERRVAELENSQKVSSSIASQIKELEDECDTLHREQMVMRKISTENSNAREELMEQLEETKRFNASLNRKLARRTQQCEFLQRELDENKELVSQLTRRVKNKEQMDATIESLRARNQDLETENGSLRLQQQKLSRTLEIEERELAYLRADIDTRSRGIHHDISDARQLTSKKKGMRFLQNSEDDV